MTRDDEEFTENEKEWLIRHLIIGEKKSVNSAERRSELIEEKIKEGGFFDFYGHNCNSGGYTRYNGGSDSDDDCPGWDGESRRCDCGNRRVSWEYDEENDRIYAEAW